MKSQLRKLRPLLPIGLVGLGVVATVMAGPRLFRPTQAKPSPILRSVKNNPDRALQLCQQFKAANASGQSVYSEEHLEKVASQEGITSSDSELLITYVMGLYCPEVN